MKLTIEQVQSDAAEEVLIRCRDAGAAWVKAVLDNGEQGHRIPAIRNSAEKAVGPVRRHAAWK